MRFEVRIFSDSGMISEGTIDATHYYFKEGKIIFEDRAEDSNRTVLEICKSERHTVTIAKLAV